MASSEWADLRWTVEEPSAAAIPEGVRVAYPPGLGIVASRRQLIASNLGPLARRPWLLRHLAKGIGPGELLRGAVWSRTGAFFGVRRLTQAGGPAWSASLLTRRPSEPALVFSEAEARAGCVTVIISQDRSEQLVRAIRSVLGVISDHVLVVDGGSSDDSVEAATAAGAHVVSRPFDRDFAAQRNFGSEQALKLFGPRWIALVDSDEEVGVDLARLYLSIMRRRGRHDAVYGPMVTMVDDELWMPGVDYRPMLFRPTLRWVGAGNERLGSRRPVFIPIGGPMVVNVKTLAQALRSRLLYASLRPGVVPDEVIERDRARLERIEAEGAADA